MEGELVFPLYMEGDYKGWRERERRGTDHDLLRNVPERGGANQPCIDAIQSVKKENEYAFLNLRD
jgi:hypothetical protein